MFCENLKTMRKAKGYTQEELAIKLNVVRQTVSKWEKGLSVPDAHILSKIVDILDTKVSILLGKMCIRDRYKAYVSLHTSSRPSFPLVYAWNKRPQALEYQALQVRLKAVVHSYTSVPDMPIH